ncbi:RCC1 domain-containing protein [Luteibacter sp. PPL552]
MASARDDNPARRIFRRFAHVLLGGLLTLMAAAPVHAAENEDARWDRGLFVGIGPGPFSACLDPGAASTYGFREPVELAWNGQDWIASKNHAVTGAWHVRAGARGAPASVSRTVGTLPPAVPLELRKLYFAKQPVLDCAHWLPGPRDDFLREARATPPLIATGVAVATGLSCAILDDGTPRCWGDVGSGSIGADNGSSVAVLPVQGVRQLGLTARACALRNDGSIACWGGRAGGGEAAHPALIGAPAKATAISLGSQLCALLVDGWSVACARPQPVLPARLAVVAGIRGAIFIAAGDYGRSCAVTHAGEVACWGRLAPPPVINEDEDSIQRGVMRIAGVEQAAAVVSGRVQDCALLRTGKVSCWSYDAQSQMLPAAALPLEHVTAVSSGDSLTCALTEAGEVSCWSDPYTNAAGITKVAGLNDASMIAVGGDHACALLRGGSVRCWGRNISAQLGSLHDLLPASRPSDDGMTAHVVFGFADGPSH